MFGEQQENQNTTPQQVAGIAVFSLRQGVAVWSLHQGVAVWNLLQGVAVCLSQGVAVWSLRQGVAVMSKGGLATAVLNGVQLVAVADWNRDSAWVV